MSVAPGSRLGAYEILAHLGVGGMGEVYRAKDTKLGREVALKIFPATFRKDPERLARFRREAQVLAALNHSHIGAINLLGDCMRPIQITAAIADDIASAIQSSDEDAERYRMDAPCRLDQRASRHVKAGSRL